MINSRVTYPNIDDDMKTDLRFCLRTERHNTNEERQRLYGSNLVNENIRNILYIQ